MVVKRGERKGRGREEEKRERKGKRKEEEGVTRKKEEKKKGGRVESKEWAFSSEKSFNFPAVLFCVKTGDFE